MPACSHANIVPVRPKPVMISSAMRSTSWRVQSSRARRRYSGWWKRMPRGALHQGLDDEGGDLAVALREDRARARRRHGSRPAIAAEAVVVAVRAGKGATIDSRSSGAYASRKIATSVTPSAPTRLAVVAALQRHEATSSRGVPRLAQ